MLPRRPPRRQERAADETIIIVDREYALQQVRSLTMQLNTWRRLLGLEPVLSSARAEREATEAEDE